MNRLNQNDFWDGAGAFWRRYCSRCSARMLVRARWPPGRSSRNFNRLLTIHAANSPRLFRRRSGAARCPSAIFRGAAIGVPLLLLTLAGRARDGARHGVGAQCIRDHHQSHYSLALQYHRGMSAPVCLAKGRRSALPSRSAKSLPGTTSRSPRMRTCALCNRRRR